MGWYEHFVKLSDEMKAEFNRLPDADRAEMQRNWAEKDIKPVFEALEQFVNRSDTEELELLAEYCTSKMHRYLQEEFFEKFILAVIKRYAAAHEAGRCDARNAYACSKSAQILDLLDI